MNIKKILKFKDKITQSVLDVYDKNTTEENPFHFGNNVYKRCKLTLLWMEKNGCALNSYQKRFFQEMMNVSIKCIYGRVSYTNFFDSIVKNHGLSSSNLSNEIFIISGRRVGKTYATALHAILMCVFLKKNKSCIFSFSEESACRFLETCSDLINKISHLISEYEVTLKISQKQITFYHSDGSECYLEVFNKVSKLKF